MVSQIEIEVHFWVLIGAAILFTIGVIAFVVNFFQHGMPTDEALEIKASTNEVAQALNNSQTNVSTKIMESMTRDEVRELVGLDDLEEGGEELTGATKPDVLMQSNEG